MSSILQFVDFSFYYLFGYVHCYPIKVIEAFLIMVEFKGFLTFGGLDYKRGAMPNVFDYSPVGALKFTM